MILTKLQMTDFRVYSGKHEIDLAPKTKYGKSRPVILFGGLNGAGKTSILTAIRLALYGRQALGKATSKKSYLKFLEKCVHRTRGQDSDPTASSVTLEFSYAHMGVLNEYRIERSWSKANNTIKESLCLFRDNKYLKELNQEQCQAFLNELIPIGVSDLFFFDGEKIADLAAQSGGLSLGDSIKKLIGLDVIETLQADLSLYLKASTSSKAPLELRALISTHENRMAESKQLAEEEILQYQHLHVSLVDMDKQIQDAETELLSGGGAWAKSRESELIRHAELQAELNLLEVRSREIVAENFPLSLCPTACKALQLQMEEEDLALSSQYQSQGAEQALKSLRTSLDASKRSLIEPELEKELKRIDELRVCYQPTLDVSKTVRSQIEAACLGAATGVKGAAEVYSRLVELREQIELLASNLNRAPEEEILSKHLAQVKKLHAGREKLLATQKAHALKHKEFLRAAIEDTRALIKLYDQVDTFAELGRSEENARLSRALLKDFSAELTKSKLSDLEGEFFQAFARLARKEDLLLHAKIDPESFDVTLLGEQGQEIPKEELSAGERQIFAVAMLDALAKTSGRNLPVIIDTPLGRLDSYHRKKIVDNYFPNASHQVLVLSTDTEIDHSFFEGLSKNISRSYELVYDSDTKSSVVNEGYFWKQQSGAA